MSSNTVPILLRADQVAEILRVSPRVAADLMKQMPRVNIGRSAQRPRWAVKQTDVFAFLESRKMQPEVQQKRERRKTTKALQVTGLLDENGHIARRR